MAYVYILRCADSSYYTGSTTNLDRRLHEHRTGASPTAYTFRHRPVTLVWALETATLEEARILEHQIQGWRRAKKEALMRGDFDMLHQLVCTERWKKAKKS